MKPIHFIKGLFTLLLLSQLTSCESALDSPVYSQLSDKTVNTVNGMNSVLNSAYGNAQLQGFWPGTSYLSLSLLSSGEVYSQYGGVAQKFNPIQKFTWGSNNALFGYIWDTGYAGIRDANIALANIENDKFSPEFEKETTAEARFIRGWLYAVLYYNFGPVPLHTTPEDDPVLARASLDTMKTFIEQDLTAASNNLPVDQDEFGKATKGAALGALCKFYLNTKQWQKSADVAQKIISLNKYELVDHYADVFSLANEGNKELLWVLPRTVANGGNVIDALSIPQQYPLEPNQKTYQAVIYFYDSFINSFKDGDTRKNLFVTQYTSTSGEQVEGLGNDQSFCLKYEPDPNANGPNQGNDIPIIRYADILLARAEALNELNGPTQESIELINKVRERAGVSDFSLSNFNKSSLRDSIFECRKKEFYFEGITREDEIRHGKFVSAAQNKGLNATEKDTLFPIPQHEIDANNKLKQNPGY